MKRKLLIAGDNQPYCFLLQASFGKSYEVSTAADSYLQRSNTFFAARAMYDCVSFALIQRLNTWINQFMSAERQ